MLLEHLSNDLEGVVAARNPEIASLVGSLRAAGAIHAAMSGSGSTVFGLFRSRREAESAARTLATPSRGALVTRTLDRAMFDRRSRIG
jgi:4-diphosphocytidyl-2-C-methyl-D-erythritol kinase